MRRIRAWSLVVVLGVVNAACAYNRPVPEEPLSAAGGPPAPLTEKWFLRANRGMTLPLAQKEGWLYGIGIDRRLIAIDLERGRTAWAYRMDGPSLSGALIRNDTIIAGSERPGGEVVAIAAQTGRIGWKRRIGYVGAPLTLNGDVVVAQTRTRGSFGLDAGTGRVKWRLPLTGRSTVLPGGEGSGLIATLDSIYRFGFADGRVTVRAEAPGTLAADWVPSALGVVAGTGEGELLLIEPGTLRPKWRVRLDGPVLVSPAVRGDTAWVATQPNTLWRIDLATGDTTRLFKHSHPVTAPPFSWNGTLLIGDARGILSAYGATGEVAWRLAVGRPIDVAPIEVAGDLVVFGGRGDVRRYSR
jgi:outer membrane protein assembly factor BamB